MKKTIIFLSIALVIILFLIIILPSLLRKKDSKLFTQTNIQLLPKNASKKTISPTKSIPSSFYSPEFNAQYSLNAKKYLVTKKSTAAETDEKIKLWLSQNNLKEEDIRVIEDLPQGSQQITDKSTGGANPPSKEINMLTEFINVLFQMGGVGTSPEASASPSPFPISEKKPPASGKFIYYPQCRGNYDDYPLPAGCNICRAGCGPTSVAMILSSYISWDWDPVKTVDLYASKGFYAGCSGTSYSDAKAILNQMGLKTTDYMIYDNALVNEVADDFKNYLKNGWTIFTLARYCDAGCGHYFWITDIDENNNVWAYDPYYGRLQSPPFNENQYYPFPKYRVAFGVKKI